MTDGAAPAEVETLEALVHRELLLRRLVDDALAAEKKKKEGAFWKHPAVLLVLTFFLTGIVGSVLTSGWQDAQWAGQEKYRADDLATKERLETITLATETIATSFAAVEDVLHLFFWEWPADSRVVSFSERGKHWRDESRKWRVAEKVLIVRVRSNFSDPKIAALLQEIIAQRRELGNNTVNLLWIADTTRRPYSEKEIEEIDKLSKTSLAIVNEVTMSQGKLQQLAQLMLAETERRRPKPKGLFSF